MTTPDPEHLNNHHRDTVRKIFEHPVSHNIEWHEVVSLLEAVGTVDVGHDGRITVRVGPEREFFEAPPGKNIDEQMVVDLRRMLTKVGFGPS